MMFYHNNEPKFAIVVTLLQSEHYIITRKQTQLVSMSIDNLITVRHLDTKRECIGRYRVTITFDRQGVGDDIYIR